MLPNADRGNATDEGEAKINESEEIDAQEDVEPNAAGKSAESTKILEVPTEFLLMQSTRERWPLVRYDPSEYIILAEGREPQSFEEAMNDGNKEKWMKYMKDVMQPLHENILTSRSKFLKVGKLWSTNRCTNWRLKRIVLNQGTNLA